MEPVLFISAGEASGEHYGALLAAELRRQLAAAGRPAKLIGMGGPRMEAAGVERIVRAEDVAVMGFTEIVSHLPRIYREFRRLKQAIRSRRPAVAVLIDFPEIHFRLAREFHRLGIPVVYFVSPQIWAWKEHRIRLVREYVRRMLVIFPFEEPYYRERGVEAEFVGHPLAELPAPTVSREEFARQNQLDPERSWIGLLPGSRMKEIEANLPETIEAAILLAHDSMERGDREPQFIVPLAPTLTAEQRRAVAEMVAERCEKLTIRLVHEGSASGSEQPITGGARATLFHARASVVASGTATVEAALIGNPFVVVYRVSPVTFAIAKRLVKVPHVAMANLIAGKEVVPELIQHDFTAANIVQQLSPLLPDGPVRESMKRDLAAIQEALRVQSANGPGSAQGAIGRVASAVVHELNAVGPEA